MFRKVKSYAFVMLYLIAMLRPITPFIEYAINYDYISKVLCVNKDKPELSCNGKCHLMRELKKQKENDFKSLEISFKEYPIGFVEILSLPSVLSFCFKTSQQFFYRQVYTFKLTKLLEHPPEFI